MYATQTQNLISVHSTDETKNVPISVQIGRLVQLLLYPSPAKLNQANLNTQQIYIFCHVKHLNTN